jgi:two-component system response regulator AtoC
MGQHGAACLGGRLEGYASNGAGTPGARGASGTPGVSTKPAHLIRRGNAMTDEAAGKAGIEGTGAGAHILLFEDDDTLAGLLARVLRTEGYHVDVLDTADALPVAKLGRYDVVLSDIHLANDTSGHDVLKRIRAASPTTPVILMTAFADIEGAMNAVGEGAYDYLAKPIEPTDLKRMVGEAIERRRLAKIEPAAPTRADVQAIALIVGTTPAMLTVYKTVAHVAPTTATVLIVGESGTGKELVARAIHAKSPRATKPFVAINCGALPESILESELFGHERGSFTGASAQKRGLFEEAKGGTLFLDEIGEISVKMQVQLLRVLQEAEIRRVGAAETIKVDVRVVAASNRDLRAEVTAGRFREDLLFRLQVVTVTVPPVRERRGDIPLLIKHFILRHAERLGRPAPHVAPEVFEMLAGYEFPGNVRELSHIIERAMLLAREGVITATDLPPEVTKAWTVQGSAGGSMGSLADDWPTLQLLERRYIDRVLSRTGGNKTRAAEVLGIDRRTLNRMFARERAAATGRQLTDEELDALEHEEEAKA